jgi:CHAT domain-containing protein
MSIRSISIPGVKVTEKDQIPVAGSNLEVDSSYKVSAAIRSESQSVSIDVNEKSIIELKFEDDTIWICSPDTLNDVFPEAKSSSRAGGADLVIPSSLKRESERGFFTDVLLSQISIFNKSKFLKNKVHDLAKDLEEKLLNNSPGLFITDRNIRLSQIRDSKKDEPFLLFIHGTCSSTEGSYKKVTPEVWSAISSIYSENNILAFQHETLTKSPLDNVHDLVKELPEGAVLDLITYSRGGIVGDILARFCSKQFGNKGFSDIELTCLVKSGPLTIMDTVKSIREIVKAKAITVRKHIRVASPSAGTILASSRLDWFFNITMNLSGIATAQLSNPIFLAFKDLISAIVESRNDTSVLPGLEAMNPDSDFVKAFNNYAAPHEQDRVQSEDSLFVIAGNSKPGFNLKSLLTLASRLFYWENNDLVVNTDSMYCGTKRLAPAKYYLDEKDNVNHFNYFVNSNTSGAIISALKAKENEIPAQFRSSIPGRLTDKDRSAALKIEGGDYERFEISGKKPIVVLIPGIMGSNLYSEDDKIWINYSSLILGKLEKIRIGNKITAKSLMRSSYSEIGDYLSKDYDVYTFPYDWRMSLQDSAVKLDKVLNDLMKNGQPVKVIAHSMGGVLFREFILNHKDTWKTLNNSAGFQLVMLGVPWKGSHKIAQVLTGIDSTVRMLSRIDLAHSVKDLVGLFAKCPGVLSLLPLSDDEKNNYTKTATWQSMLKTAGIIKENEKPADVGLDANELGRFAEFKKRSLENIPNIDLSKAVYVAGKDDSTPSDYQIVNEYGFEELYFLSTGEGDGSVTWETGIPEQLKNEGRVYYVEYCVHGQLANEPRIFRAISDLLKNGSTTAISRNRPVVRSAERSFRAPIVTDFDISEEGLDNALFGKRRTTKKKGEETEIKVIVTNGHLKYATLPLLVGHFNRDGIVHAEKALDKCVGGELSQRHRVGLYPGEAGSSEVLFTRHGMFKGTIVIGLGEQESFSAYQLSRAVEIGVCDYLLKINSKRNTNLDVKDLGDYKGISSLLICSDYAGLTIESSVSSIIRGVADANRKISDLLSNDPILIETLEFVEIYRDRALSCFYSIKRLIDEKTTEARIALLQNTINTRPGARQRLLTEQKEDWWTRITVRQANMKELIIQRRIASITEEDSTKQTDVKEPFISTRKLLTFSVSTGGAREEQKELIINTGILGGLLEEYSRRNNWSTDLAKTIFELILPNEFKSILKRQSNISWIVDKYTASIPWEMLHDVATSSNPVSVNAGMVRQLTTQNYRTVIRYNSNLNALVIADPHLEEYKGASQLPGANEEGRVVSKLLEENGFRTTRLIGSKSALIIESIFSSDYNIIHLAGHGIYKPECPEESGMLIGNNIFLTSNEINQMSTVPELVFINCCYIGKIEGEGDELYRDRLKLAANIGTQLIENGVKAVVAAGWAVNDSAAKVFTEAFYKHMFDGCAFGDSIRLARKLIYENYPGTNTWGAYQCYGDQFYRFKGRFKASQSSASYVVSEEAEIELVNILNELESGDYFLESSLTQLEEISGNIDKTELRNAVITATEGAIYYKLYEYEKAIEKFGSLLTVEPATFSIGTLERYANVRSKMLAAKAQTVQDKQELIEKMNIVIKDLQMLLKIGENSKRLSLMGSAYKRKAMLYAGEKEISECVILSAFYYYKAYEKLNESDRQWPFSFLNWIVLESIVVLLDPKRKWGKPVSVTIDGKLEQYELPSKETVKKKLNEFINKSESEYLTQKSYWEFINRTNSHLTLRLFDFDDLLKDELGGLEAKGKKKSKVSEADTTLDKTIDQQKKEIMDKYIEVWRESGAMLDKMTELEHLDFIISALSAARNPNSSLDNLKKLVTRLREDFDKILNSRKTN